MKMRKAFIIILAALTLVMLFSGCGGSDRTETTTPAPSDSATAYAPAMTEEILQAINDGDYAAFSGNFNDAMKQAMTEAAFNQTRDLIQGKIGTYLSKEFGTVQTQGAYTTVIYKARFSDEPEDVTVTVAFVESEGNVLVSGLWFDSPKLREQ